MRVRVNIASEDESISVIRRFDDPVSRKLEKHLEM